MFVDVLIQSSELNKPYFPSFIPPRLVVAKEYPYNRMDGTIEAVKGASVGHKTRLANVTEDGFRDGKIHCIYGYDEFYTYKIDGNRCDEVVYFVEKVDTRRPWKIEFIPGHGERIHYFKKGEEYYIKDSELNYGEYK